MTLLHVGAELGLDEFVSQVLETPAGLYAATQRAQGDLPIHVAAKNGHAAIVEMLLPFSGLSVGADVETLMREASEGWGQAPLPSPNPPGAS